MYKGGHMNDKKNGFSLKERFKYWFDNRMAKGSLSFIRFLIVACILLAMLMAGLIILLGFNDGETGSVFWDSIATVLNAWMPYSDEGSPGYIALMSITAIAGVLFTSVLIGIITSAIEEKIDDLKRGNSIVLEEGHIVVLGFRSGEYTLLRQLILAENGEPSCIVLAESLERAEMEQEIAENVEVPENVRIVCRTVNITDPASLEICSIETCKTVIVSPSDDVTTIKSVLAVLALIRKKNAGNIQINAVIADNQYKLPASLEKEHNITVLPTNNILGRMIAHSCTQMGLSQTFREVFNFEGAEFYFTKVPKTEGLPFHEAAAKIDNGAPVGINHEGTVTLNPAADTTIQEGDKILVFAENQKEISLLDNPVSSYNIDIEKKDAGETESVVIFGYNDNLPLIIKELPANVRKVILAGTELSEEAKKVIHKAATKKEIELSYFEGDIHSEELLTKIAKESKHIVLLSDHEKDADEADVNVIFLLMNLWEIRKRLSLTFNITAELQKESNEELVAMDEYVDFLVSTNISSLVLAQLSENPELKGVFQEILSNRGNELYLKNAKDFLIPGKYAVSDLRQYILKEGYSLLGIVDSGMKSTFLLNSSEQIIITEEDQLIVIGED